MHPQSFLFSSTPRRDYRYLVPLPPQCPADCTAFIRTQLEQMQRGAADGTIQVFIGTENALVLRLVASGIADLYSRPIYSLEGFSFPQEDIRALWLSLPEWLPGFYAAPSLYQTLVQGEDTVDVPAQTLLQTFFAETVEETLLRYVLAAAEPHSLSFDGEMPQAQPAQVPDRKQWIPKELRSCRIEMVFQKKEKTARLQAVCCGQPPYVIAQSPLLRQKEAGWQFSELEAAADAMEQLLDAAGWQYRTEGGSAQ
ncbi:MAG: hypothetical protein Q4P20_08405 [Eubacteriales bacterium]|nr:hypothetical protein [Eubacteriales bacterium]